MNLSITIDQKVPISLEILGHAHYLKTYELANDVYSKILRFIFENWWNADTLYLFEHTD